LDIDHEKKKEGGDKMSGMIGRTFEAAIKKGQDGMDKHIQTLTEQNNIMIDNMNEIIDLQKAICKKLEIEYKEEE